MSIRTHGNPSELPGIGRSTTVVFTSRNASSKVAAEYISLDANSQQAAHASAGEVIVFCILGEVVVRIEDQQISLHPNELAHIGAGSLYQLTTEEPSAVIVTTLNVSNRGGDSEAMHSSEDDEVQEASEESFPASDSPSFNPGA